MKWALAPNLALSAILLPVISGCSSTFKGIAADYQCAACRLAVPVSTDSCTDAIVWKLASAKVGVEYVKAIPLNINVSEVENNKVTLANSCSCLTSVVTFRQGRAFLIARYVPKGQASIDYQTVKVLDGKKCLVGLTIRANKSQIVIVDRDIVVVTPSTSSFSIQIKSISTTAPLPLPSVVVSRGMRLQDIRISHGNYVATILCNSKTLQRLRGGVVTINFCLKRRKIPVIIQ